MKTLTLAYDHEGVSHTWKAEHDHRNGGWLIVDHEGDKKFFGGSFAEVLDYMQRITLPNWGMRLIAIGGAPQRPSW